jgi:eukaryotic-like serine/threonine-protein kinase
MPRNPLEASRTLSLSEAWRVNDACERFEADWRADLRPEIEATLARALDRDRLALFPELLALERELREARGERPTALDYLARFPEWAGEIGRAFADNPYPGEVSTEIQPREDPGATLAFEGSTGIDAEALLARFGDYDLLDEIARGGMGVVYRARQRSLNRLVALKMIRAGRLATPEERERFLFEAEAVANLEHPHIVPIFDIGEHLGQDFFSMRLVEGGSLARRISECGKDPRAAARLVATIAEAVDYAHGQGIWHRDLKPANILIDTAGRPFVTDFGLAKRVREDEALTRSGTIVGTPSYMAPEQASGSSQKLSAAADVYSLGAVLYELLAGRPPFRADTVRELLEQVLEREPEPPGQFRAGLPVDLERICLKCLEKNPQARYPTAKALSDDLERFLRGESVEAGRPNPLQQLVRWTRREPELVSHLGGLGLMAMVTEFNFRTSSDRDPRVHYTVLALFAVWAIFSALFQSGLRREWRVGLLRFVWSAVDILLLAVILRVLDALESSLVVGFALLIAASGLWSTVRLVWFSTGLAMVCYALLALDSHARHPWVHFQYPNAFLAALAVTGFVIARQVRRMGSLSRYYEQRGFR